MKRYKIGAALLAFILCFSLVLPVHAEPATIGSDGALSYLINDNLYAFYELDEGLDFDSAIVNAVSTEITYKETGSIDKITDTNTNIKYLFIIDNSASVKAYKENIKAFMQSVADNQDLKTSYTLATFGERFDVVKDNMTDINTVLHEVDGIGFNEQYTDPYTAVVSADIWLHSNILTEGDIVSVVLITDGDPDLRDAGKEDELQKKASDTVEKLTDITYSTLCLNKWTKDADSYLTEGSGLDFIAKSKGECKEAGEGLADYFDSLIVSSFTLTKSPKSDFDFDLSIFGTDSDGNKVTVDKVVFEGIHNEKNLNVNPDVEPVSEPEPPVPSSDDPQVSPNPGPETPDSEEVSEPASEENEETSEAVDSESGKLPEFLQKILDFAKAHLLIVIVAGAGLLLIIAAIIVAVNVVKAQNKKLKKAQTEANLHTQNVSMAAVSAAAPIAAAAASQASVPPADMTGVLPMTLEVYVGRCMNTSPTLYLKDQLVIGSAPTSDIVFDDGDVDPQNSRIRLVDGVVYIEDMSSARGTAIEGMRIQGRNKLRSGNVISIGNVQFSLKYGE